MARKKRSIDNQPKKPPFQRVKAVSGAVVILLMLGTVAAVVFFSTRGDYRHASSYRYVGPAECEGCHEEQAESWRETRMAKSFQVLLPGEKSAEKEMVGLDPEQDYSHDESCLPCHTTGYGQVGGFVSIEETPEMAGVTCEACHGAGGSYAKTVMDPDDPTFKVGEARDAGLIYPPTARVCTQCHNEGSPFINAGYQFDYDSKMPKGTHKHFQLKYAHGD